MKKTYLSKTGWAGGLGIFFGLALFIHSLLKMAGIQFWWFNDTMWAFYSSAFPLSATLGGAFIGLISGAICGIVCGFLLAVFHNFAVDKFQK